MVLKNNDLQIVGYINVSIELQSGLTRVFFLACVQCLVLGVVDYQVFHAQLAGKSASVECSAVMFLVGLKALAVVVETESLAKEPVGSLDILAVVLVEWLVAETCHTLSVGRRGYKSILFLFSREDVKTLYLHLGGPETITICHFVHEYGVADADVEFRGEHGFAHHAEDAQHFLVAIEVEASLVSALRLQADDFAYHPDDAKYMVSMGMGDEHVVNVGEVDAGILHLAQDAIATTCVNQQVVAVVLQNKTGVVALGDHCVARAEDDEAIVHVI